LASIERLASSGADQWLLRIARSFLVRALAEANYCCTDSVPLPRLRHFGLAVPLYTHFTYEIRQANAQPVYTVLMRSSLQYFLRSPIRRYADVMVHRLLLESIGLESPDSILSSEEVSVIAQHLNSRNRSAKLAQRASQDLFWSLFIKQSGAQQIEGIITAVHDTGIQVLLPRYPLLRDHLIFHCNAELFART
jgi:exoribonuclease R